MKRPVTAAASGMSLLCVMTAVLWAQSYSTADFLRLGYWHRRPHPFYGPRGYLTATDLRILHCRGRLGIGTFMSGCVDGPTFHRTGPGEHGEKIVWTRLKADETDGLVSSGTERMLLGLGFRFDATRWFLSIPDGATIAILLLVTGWLVRRRSHRAIPGLCCACRYDLTGNVSGVCPECGSAVAERRKLSMTRRIFNFTAATSLLLCLATMALWVQTVWVTKFNDNSRFEEGVQMLCGWIGVGQGRIIATTFPHSLHFEFEDHRIYGDGPRFEVIENPYAAIHSHDQFRSPVSIRRSTLEWGGVRYFFLGFAFSPYHLERYSDGQICRKTVIEIPLWLPILVTAALPVWRLRQFLKNRQRGGFSLCVRCSYDLTGNMSGICPECGVPVGGRVATT